MSGIVGHKMSIKQLIASLPIQWVSKPREVWINGLSMHSKSVAPGNLFISTLGTTAEGMQHIDEALAAGAAAILTPEEQLCVFSGIPQLCCKDLKQVLPALAATLYPSPRLKYIGVTGTNGKTTVSFLLQHLLEGMGYKVGLIGTICYRIGTVERRATLTTPDVITLHRLFFEMESAGCDWVVMEVSSHSLDQQRVAGIPFSAAVFTNLTQDHLDYHGTMDRYAEAKKKLFTNLSESAFAIFNDDSPYSELMQTGCRATCLTYGWLPSATLRAQSLVFHANRVECQLHIEDKEIPCTIPLPGRFNVLNALAAITCCHALGGSLPMLASLCSSFSGVPGRLQKIHDPRGVHVYIDFAHTPDALAQVCSTLRETVRGRLLVVFGAGGGRDPTKRSKMGAVVDQYADFAYLTSDNPRNEDPIDICNQIAEGFTSTQYEVIVDRRQAILQSLERAAPGDAVLIAGKGHESSQTIGNVTLPFEDGSVVEECIEEILGTPHLELI